MSTVNISLPREQINLIDRLVSLYGFANRSEFIRSIVRLLMYKPELIEKASYFPFVAPQENSVKKVLAGFKKTNKYSSSFLKDLKNGLKSSDYFSP